MSEKKKLLSGHTWVPVTEEEQKELMAAGILTPGPMVRLHPGEWMLPDDLVNKYLDKIYTFKFRSDDLIVMAYPKCGTTWMQEILWTMANNADLTHPETNTPILDRSVDITFDIVFDSITYKSVNFDSLRKWFAKVCPGRKEEDGIMLQICELMQGRRIIKCHLPLPLLPPDILQTAKIVYVARNPKDAIVSYHSMIEKIALTDSFSTFEIFTRIFMNNQLVFGPYWRHVEAAWKKRKDPNMEFIFFEELKADTMKHLQRLNDFIGTNLTQSQLDAVAHHTSFKSMKDRGEPMRDPLFKNFFRKGTTGDWKGHFSPKLQEEVDEWIEENSRRIDLIHKWD